MSKPVGLDRPNVGASNALNGPMAIFSEATEEKTRFVGQLVIDAPGGTLSHLRYSKNTAHFIDPVLLDAASLPR